MVELVVLEVVEEVEVEVDVDEVVVEEVEGNPGYYNSRFYLRPHYQLEGLTVSLRLVRLLMNQRAS